MKGPGGRWPSASGVEGRCPTPTWRGTRGAAGGCGTPEVGQAPDGGRMAVNGTENGNGGVGGWDILT